MLNYIAQLMTSFFVNGPFIAKGSMTPQTEILPQKLQLPNIIPNTQLTTSLYIALLMCVLYGFVLNRTVSDSKSELWATTYMRPKQEE